MIKPARNNGQTKHVWVSFFNDEAKEALKQYLDARKDRNPKLFPTCLDTFNVMWREAREKTGIYVTAQVLREWFACEMGRLGMPDRYIDAFCGRVPRSILARHYTDYSPDRLKEIYDGAGLRVLQD